MHRRKSPRKNQMQPRDYYGIEGNRDRVEDNTLGLRAGPSTKNKRQVGYKRSRKQFRAPSQKKTTSLSSSESSLSEYEQRSESDDDEKGRMVDKRRKGPKNTATDVNSGRKEMGDNGDDDIVEGPTREARQKPHQMEAASVNRARRNVRDDNDNIDDVSSDDDIQEQEITRRNLATVVRRRIFGETSNEENEDNDESEQEQQRSTTWKNELRKKDNEIAELKRKLNEMQTRTSITPSQRKTGWTGEEINFVKDINDFCKDKLYTKEKFLRKNWQEYLPNDRRSLYSVCMKHLSIPEGSDPMDIWGRVIVPAVRDKYQSMKCNIHNKIKSIYMSMGFFF